MGMASSDNDREIIEADARRRAYRDRPRNPNTWDHQASEEANIAYRDSLVRWAENLPEEPNPWANDSR